jgi:hypothetical protein
MDQALHHYPFEHMDIIRTLPDDHWFVRRYRQLSRMPTRAELQLQVPPFGLLHDDDYHEEMHLRAFLGRRIARRVAAGQIEAMAPQSKHRYHHMLKECTFKTRVLTRMLFLFRL